MCGMFSQVHSVSQNFSLYSKLPWHLNLINVCTVNCWSIVQGHCTRQYINYVHVVSKFILFYRRADCIIMFTLCAFNNLSNLHVLSRF